MKLSSWDRRVISLFQDQLFLSYKNGIEIEVHCSSNLVFVLTAFTGVGETTEQPAVF